MANQFDWIEEHTIHHAVLISFLSRNPRNRIEAGKKENAVREPQDLAKEACERGKGGGGMLLRRS